MQPFQDGGPPVECNEHFDQSNVQGKTAVITGGANGMGEAYVRALIKAGAAFVVFGDIDEECGRIVESQFEGKAQFVKCDISQWQDQLVMFKQAIAKSPTHRIDIVIANAGVSGTDPVYEQDLDLEDPEEPNLRIFQVNGAGTLYTTKLALHYFKRQYKLDPEASKDQHIIFQGSLAGYIDLNCNLQYSLCKTGMRALMRNLRRFEHENNIRVNYIAPWFVRTKILTKGSIEKMDDLGAPWATVSDAALAVMKLCSDTNINSRALAIVPRELSPCGYLDLEADEYPDGSHSKKFNDGTVQFKIDKAFWDSEKQE